MLASTCSIRLATFATVKREILVAVVDGLELTSVDGHDGAREQVELPAEHQEPCAGRADRRPVVAAEVGDGLEVRHQAASQPHQLDIALGLPLKPPARLDAVEIAVNVKLEQIARRIARASRRLRVDSRKTG